MENDSVAVNVSSILWERRENKQGRAQDQRERVNVKMWPCKSIIN
jgi:hypothetical protein